MFSRHIGSGLITKTAICKRNEEDVPVQSGLALTPSQMMEMANHGVPISTQQLGNQYIDGKPNPSFDIPLDQQRGIDIGDIWQAAQTSKKKIRSAMKAAQQAKQSTGE